MPRNRDGAKLHRGSLRQQTHCRPSAWGSRHVYRSLGISAEAASRLSTIKLTCGKRFGSSRRAEGLEAGR